MQTNKYDRKNYIIGVLVLVVAVLSLVVAYLSYNSTWKVAERAGNFDKADISVSLLGLDLPNSGSVQLVIGAKKLSTHDIPVVGAIPFTIRSTGKKSIDGVSLTFQYPSILGRSLLNVMKLNASGAYFSQEIKTAFSQTDNVDFEAYQLPTLDPGIGAVVSEPIFLSDTNRHIDVPVKTKDGVNMRVSAEISYIQKFTVSVSARDLAIRSWIFELSAVKADSIKALTQKYISDIVPSKREQIRTNVSSLQYLLALIFSNLEENVYFVYSPIRETRVSDVVVFGPAEQQETAKVTYDLLSWKLLFKNSIKND